jgi:adenosylcobinamide-GDP ribazoletransferase
MKGLLLALQFMTRLPLPRIASTEADFSASMRWFPATGLVVGILVAIAGIAGARIDSWVGALLALTCWVLVTGALHLDGLGDMADAAGAAHQDRAKLSAVLSDPHIGSFGATAIALQLIAKLVLLRLALEHGAYTAILLAPAVARIGPLVWTLWLPPLHPGLGARFRGAIGWRHVGLWGMAASGTVLLLPGLAIALLLIPLWALWVARTIGGIFGDGHGAGIELIESGLLLGLVAWP